MIGMGSGMAAECISRRGPATGPVRICSRAMRLEGSKALVTGGASGIGAAIARRLAAEGAERRDRRPERRRRPRGRRRDRRGRGRPRRHRPGLGRSRGRGSAARSRSWSTTPAWTSSDSSPTTDPEHVAAGDRHEPGGRPHLHPRRASRHAAGRLRADRQHRLGGRAGRLEGLGGLLGRQGGRDRVHEDDRARERPLRDHRERDRAGPDRHAAPDAAPPSSARSASG